MMQNVLRRQNAYKNTQEFADEAATEAAGEAAGESANCHLDESTIGSSLAGNDSLHDLQEPSRAFRRQQLHDSLKQHDAVIKKDQSSSDFLWKTGISQIDLCLPPEGISRDGLHEIEPLLPLDMPSLTGFCFGLLSRLSSTKPIIWCVTASQVGEFGQLYAFGLSRYGISPAQIIFAKVSHPLHLQFALEEAIKTEGIGAVIGEGPRPSFTGSRRLSLLCKTHQTPCLLMNAQRDESLGSAALTRWQIAPVQGVEDPRDPFGPGLPTWRVALPRSRSGKTMPPLEAESQRHNPHENEQNNDNTSYPWRIVWDDQTLSFRPAAVFSGRAVSQNPATAIANKKAMVGQAG